MAIAQSYARTAKHADIGVSTLPEYHGRGFATAAASLVARRVQEAGQTPVWSTGEDNLPSRRIAEKLGFTEEDRRVYVIVDLVEPPEERSTLGDGFRVEARVVIDEARNALKIPTSALFRVGSESAVFQVVDGVVRQQTVKIGRQNGLEAEVLEGLAEGDRLVLHPSDQIEEGVQVRQR